MFAICNTKKGKYFNINTYGYNYESLENISKESLFKEERNAFDYVRNKKLSGKISEIEAGQLVIKRIDI